MKMEKKKPDQNSTKLCRYIAKNQSFESKRVKKIAFDYLGLNKPKFETWYKGFVEKGSKFEQKWKEGTSNMELSQTWDLDSCAEYVFEMFEVIYDKK